MAKTFNVHVSNGKSYAVEAQGFSDCAAKLLCEPGTYPLPNECVVGIEGPSGTARFYKRLLQAPGGLQAEPVPDLGLRSCGREPHACEVVADSSQPAGPNRSDSRTPTGGLEMKDPTILSLQMDGPYPSVSWLDEKMNRYSAQLESKHGTPVRPFRVKLSRPLGWRSEKRYVFRRPPGETKPSTRIDSEASAHAPMVNLALQRAEAEDLWAAAVEREAEREAARVAEAGAAEIAAMRAKLHELDGHEDSNVVRNARHLLDCDDAILLAIGRKLRGA